MKSTHHAHKRSQDPYEDYALSVIQLFAVLPKRTETQILGRQLLRSGTSIGAQYREASRAQSQRRFHQ